MIEAWDKIDMVLKILCTTYSRMCPWNESTRLNKFLLGHSRIRGFSLDCLIWLFLYWSVHVGDFSAWHAIPTWRRSRTCYSLVPNSAQDQGIKVDGLPTECLSAQDHSEPVTVRSALSAAPLILFKFTPFRFFSPLTSMSSDHSSVRCRLLLGKSVLMKKLNSYPTSQDVW